MITVVYYNGSGCQLVSVSSIIRARLVNVKMEDEKLIEMVRKYEFIYNLKHPKYMDIYKKEMAWKEIGEKVGESGKFFVSLCCIFMLLSAASPACSSKIKLSLVNVNHYIV